MVARADLSENVHRVVFNPFFDDFSGFDEGDVYVGDGNSFSGCRDALIFSCVGTIHCYAAWDFHGLRFVPIPLQEQQLDHT
jgi:hypothetical protein